MKFPLSPILLAALVPVPGGSFAPAIEVHPCAASVQGGKEDVREDWLASDVQRIEQLSAVLDLEDLDVEALKRGLPGADVRDDRSIGFGARRLVLAVYGGYTTAWIHVLATDAGTGRERKDALAPGRVAELRCDQLGSTDAWKLVESRLQAHWGVRAKRVERGFRVELWSEAIAASLSEQCERELGRSGVTPAPGAPASAAIPAALRAASERLASPFEDLRLGSLCGEGGDPPPGRAEIDALLKAGRHDLVRAALRGMNPEGRAWSAWALLAGEKRGAALEPADRAAIAKLRALPVELVVCDGCEVEHLRFDGAIAAIRE